MYSNPFYETSSSSNPNYIPSSTPSTSDTSWDSYNSGDDQTVDKDVNKSNKNKSNRQNKNKSRRVSHSSSILGRKNNDYEQFDDDNDNNNDDDLNNDQRRKSIIKKSSSSSSSSKRKFSGNSSTLSSIGYSSMKHSLKHVSFK